MKQQNAASSIEAYMGRPVDQGGASGWIPYHPEISRAIAPHMPARDANLSSVCALFLTVCYKLRGRSTVAEDGWIEKTRADWMECLGVSKRTADYVVRFMSYDEAKAPPAGTLGLVQRRLGGYRNAAQYRPDALRVTQFWLTNGPQPALTAGEVAPQARRLVAPQARRTVAPQARRLVAPQARQPHKNTLQNGNENISKGATAPDAAVLGLLGLYGFSDKAVTERTAAQLATRPDGALQLYYNAEIALAEQAARANTDRAIISVVGWTWRRLQNVDAAAPVLTWPAVDEQLTTALAELDDSGRRGRTVPDYEAIERAAAGRATRRAAVCDALGVDPDQPSGPPRNIHGNTAEEIAKAQAIRADLERRRQRRAAKE